MQQSLGKFEPPLHAAGKSLRLFLGAIGETDPAQHFADALLECGAAQAVNMADQHQVLFRRQLDVDALLLEYEGKGAARRFDVRRSARMTRSLTRMTASWATRPSAGASMKVSNGSRTAIELGRCCKML